MQDKPAQVGSNCASTLSHIPVCHSLYAGSREGGVVVEVHRPLSGKHHAPEGEGEAVASCRLQYRADTRHKSPASGCGKVGGTDH